MSLDTVEDVCNFMLDVAGGPRVSDVTGSPSTPMEKLCAAIYTKTRDQELGHPRYNWQFAKQSHMLTLKPYYDEADYDEYDITNITKADPAVVTINSHPFKDGDNVLISDVGGMTEINDKIVTVANAAANTFECYELDASQYTAYTSGGTAIRYEALRAYRDGYVYRVPSDMLKPVGMEREEIDWEIIGYGDNQRLLTFYENPVFVYIKQVTSLTAMPEYFKELWAHAMGIYMAPRLQRDDFTVADANALYQLQFERSTMMDASQNKGGQQIHNENRIVNTTGLHVPGKYPYYYRRYTRWP